MGCASSSSAVQKIPALDISEGLGPSKPPTPHPTPSGVDSKKIDAANSKFNFETANVTDSNSVSNHKTSVTGNMDPARSHEGDVKFADNGSEGDEADMTWKEAHSAPPSPERRRSEPDLAAASLALLDADGEGITHSQNALSVEKLIESLTASLGSPNHQHDLHGSKLNVSGNNTPENIDSVNKPRDLEGPAIHSPTEVIPAVTMAYILKEGGVVKNWKKRWFVLSTIPEDGVVSIAWYSNPTPDLKYPFGMDQLGELNLVGYDVVANGSMIRLSSSDSKSRDLVLDFETDSNSQKLWIQSIKNHISFAKAKGYSSSDNMRSSFKRNSIRRSSRSLPSSSSKEQSESSTNHGSSPPQPLAKQSSSFFGSIFGGTSEPTSPTSGSSSAHSNTSITPMSSPTPATTSPPKSADNSLGRAKSYTTSIDGKTPPMKAGFIEKEGQRMKSWKKRWFMLVADSLSNASTLSWYENPTHDGKDRRGHLGDMNLSGYNVSSENAEDALLIKLEGPGVTSRTMLLKFDSDQEAVRNSWLQALQEHIAYSKI